MHDGHSKVYGGMADIVNHSQLLRLSPLSLPLYWNPPHRSGVGTQNGTDLSFLEPERSWRDKLKSGREGPKTSEDVKLGALKTFIFQLLLVK